MGSTYSSTYNQILPFVPLVPLKSSGAPCQLKTWMEQNSPLWQDLTRRGERITIEDICGTCRA